MQCLKLAMEKYTNLKVEDGTDMVAYTAVPEGATGRNAPGLILLQEALA